jgi:alpha-D-ribose 1-methylphosphonate 5-triphosphate synthase subunit PhnL
MSETMIRAEQINKTFTLHLQGGVQLPVLTGASLAAAAGDCVILDGASGSGKSTLLRCLFANYRPDAGAVHVRHDGAWIDLARAEPREILAVRRTTLGYVSQFLRAIPRVAAIELVAEPLRARGVDDDTARERAGALLTRLRVPERLWSLPPATFSGGEQQRVNIARGFISERPVLLLDEPTASLDEANRDTVIELINEARARGAAIVGICHDRVVRQAVATRLYDMTQAQPRSAA